MIKIKINNKLLIFILSLFVIVAGSLTIISAHPGHGAEYPEEVTSSSSSGGGSSSSGGSYSSSGSSGKSSYSSHRSSVSSSSSSMHQKAVMVEEVVVHKNQVQITHKVITLEAHQPIQIQIQL